MAVACVAMAASGVLLPTANAATSSTSTTVLCLRNESMVDKRKPRTCLLMANRNMSFGKLRWSTWGDKTAKGTGLISEVGRVPVRLSVKKHQEGYSNAYYTKVTYKLYGKWVVPPKNS